MSECLQGPDAVTYENLTLAHFLDRADKLAASAEEIKALNAQVAWFPFWLPMQTFGSVLKRFASTVQCVADLHAPECCSASPCMPTPS